MIKYAKQIFVIICCLGMVSVVSAQDSVVDTTKGEPKSGPLMRLKNIIGGGVSWNPNTNEETLTVFMGQIIGVFLSLLGTIFIFLMVYAGYNWMTAAGEEKKVEKAQHTIKVAIIGLIITAGVYAIWQYLFIRLLG